MNIFPTREEFGRLAEKGNLIPVCAELAADMETPVSAYFKITGCNKAPAWSFLLESVEGEENIGRYSILGAEPRSILIQKNGVAEHIAGKKREIVPGKDVFEKLTRILSGFKPVGFEKLPPFLGGAVGYASYDVISEIEPVVRQPEANPVDVPEAVFMITGSLIVFDRALHKIKVIALAHVESGPPSAVDKAYDTAAGQVAALTEKLSEPAVFKPMDLGVAPPDLKISSNKTPEEYKEMVTRGKKYILEGDIIQVVLSQRFSVDMPCSPLAVYRALRMINPSPYMFLLNFGDFALAGASPEVMAKCENGKMTVRPIAGTRKRGATKEEDEANAKSLLADPKERAEHIMLVDLGRNDLGRVAKTGTVKVDELMVVEKYSHVMHIVSNVTGELDCSKHGPDAVMRSAFPAGTLSGAPKIRAMQIISELEKERRGPYGGTVAYFSMNGNVNSCITIRTALIKDGKAYFQSGAGIVADSDPGYELEETRSKARAMLKALSTAQLFET